MVILQDKHSNMKKILLILLIYLLPHTVLSQTFVTGFVTDSLSGQPVELTDIAFYRITDKLFVGFTTTDSLGSFSLKLPDTYDKYYLEAEAAGYWLQTVYLENSESVSIKLQHDDTELLDELTIVQQKKSGFY